MKAFLVLCPALLLAASACAAGSASPGSVEHGEKLEVLFSSTGCFHRYSNLFVFTPGQVEIYEVTRQWSEEKHDWVRLENRRLGKVPLDRADLRRLDNLFAFYADKPGGGCTTVDDIDVTLTKGELVLETHTYSDASCSTDSLKDVLTLPALLSRLPAEPGGG